MKKTLIIASIVALGAVASQAQGLVSISLGGGNFVSTNDAFGHIGKAGGSGAGAFYYELLYSTDLNQTATPVTAFSTSLGGWTDSTVSGASGTIGLNAGKINGPNPATAQGWTAPGVTYDNVRAVEIIGWSANYGTTFAAFLTSLNAGLFTGPTIGYFGYVVGENVAGGGNVPLNAVNQWGNQTAGSGLGLNSALILNTTPIPEPATMALVGLGSLGLLALRRKK